MGAMPATDRMGERADRCPVGPVPTLRAASAAAYRAAGRCPTRAFASLFLTTVGVFR